MDKYNDWINAATDKLNEDFCDGIFDPQNESDIRCHLYHTLFQAKPQIKGLTHNHLISSELPSHTSEDRFDIAILRKRRGSSQTRLIIEIKETTRAHLTFGELEKRIIPDINKLRRYRKTLEEKGEGEALKFYKKPVVLFFFRGAGRHGIAVKTEKELRRLQEKYGDVTFKWGPL